MIKNTYHNAIRARVDTLYRRGRTDSLIAYDIGADEQSDLTLIV